MVFFPLLAFTASSSAVRLHPVFSPLSPPSTYTLPFSLDHSPRLLPGFLYASTPCELSIPPTPTPFLLTFCRSLRFRILPFPLSLLPLLGPLFYLQCVSNGILPLCSPPGDLLSFSPAYTFLPRPLTFSSFFCHSYFTRICFLPFSSVTCFVSLSY